MHALAGAFLNPNSSFESWVVQNQLFLSCCHLPSLAGVAEEVPHHPSSDCASLIWAPAFIGAVPPFVLSSRQAPLGAPSLNSWQKQLQHFPEGQQHTFQGPSWFWTCAFCCANSDYFLGLLQQPTDFSRMQGLNTLFIWFLCSPIIHSLSWNNPWQLPSNYHQLLSACDSKKTGFKKVKKKLSQDFTSRISLNFWPMWRNLIYSGPCLTFVYAWSPTSHWEMRGFVPSQKALGSCQRPEKRYPTG